MAIFCGLVQNQEWSDRDAFMETTIEFIGTRLRQRCSGQSARTDLGKAKTLLGRLRLTLSR